ncbi:MAG TPA: hypothetical protein VMG12_18550 [Polyangiaceae bacterium]|nr:hypothetical protein [Polyangiaceae bacterium]HUA47675.1 hypothetical protein [Solirubrobacteraceae bacterium]
MPGPDRAESSSVASLISAAAGTIASAEEKNTSVGAASASFSASAPGTSAVK